MLFLPPIDPFVFFAPLPPQKISLAPQNPFRKSEEFKALNMGFALDEGLAHPGNKYSVFYGECCAWCEYVFYALSWVGTKFVIAFRWKYYRLPTFIVLRFLSSLFIYI